MRTNFELNAEGLFLRLVAECDEDRHMLGLLAWKRIPTEFDCDPYGNPDSYGGRKIANEACFFWKQEAA